MREVTKRPASAVDAGFMWRDRDGGMHTPASMETRHLFYTLRMIWNNRMPEQCRFRNARMYQFGSHYSDAYLKSALRPLATELSRRGDMTPEWSEQLRTMLTWLSRLQIAHQPKTKQVTHA